MKVIDNFLPQYQFKQLQNAMQNDKFPWYFNESICHPDDGLFQFTHGIFDADSSVTYFWPFIDLFTDLLKVNKWIRIKANLQTRTMFHRNGGYHYDVADVTTAVYYVNTNNGYTKFKKSGKVVESVANRIVIFDSNLKHSGFSCTDEKRRMVVNFNWE